MKKNVAEIVMKKLNDPADHGATVSLTPGMTPSLLEMDEHQPETYCVGMEDIIAEIPLAECDTATIEYAIKQALPKAKNVWAALGFWVDQDSDTVVIEMVETYTHPGVALEKARLRGEKAIFAMKSKREIFL